MKNRADWILPCGIEIQQKLLQTAQANFKIMEIDDQIECIHADAVNFEKYGDYNVFFFFNPFSEEILQRVTDKIFRSRNEGENIVYCKKSINPER